MACKKLRKPMIGICRGAQFLCVMNGGILIQHQRNPKFLHTLETANGIQNLFMSSLHHQAQYPFGLPKNRYKILAWTNGVSPVHYGQTWEEVLDTPKECEIVYYPKNRCLGIQGHPELLGEMTDHYPIIHRSIEYCQDLLNNFLKNKL